MKNENEVLKFVSTNRIKITINGEERTIVMGMRTMERVVKALNGGAVDELTSTNGFATTILEGMRNKPEGLTTDTVIDWIDDMEKSERDTLKAFVYEQLGFMMKEYLDGVEHLTKILNKETDEKEIETKAN